MNIKEIICTAIAVASVAAFSGTAVYADAIAEPANQFYFDDPSSCDYIHWRTFEVLEDTELLMSPLKSTVSSKVQKGEFVDIGFTYTDDKGVVWGCCSFDAPAERESGWIKMSGVKEIYNVFTFLDEHESELADYNGELDDFIPKEKVVLWDYPYSENCCSVKAESWYTKDEYPFKNEIADKCWTDENGNMWIYSVRWITKDADRFGFDNCWIFLPAPEATDLSDFGYDISANEGTAVSGQLVDEMTENAREFAERSVNPAGRSLMLPAALSAGAAVVSVMLIKAMKK